MRFHAPRHGFPCADLYAFTFVDISLDGMRYHHFFAAFFIAGFQVPPP